MKFAAERSTLVEPPAGAAGGATGLVVTRLGTAVVVLCDVGAGCDSGVTFLPCAGAGGTVVVSVVVEEDAVVA